MPAVKAVQGGKGSVTSEITVAADVLAPTGHVTPQSIMPEAVSTYIKTSQSQKDDASQLEAMSHGRSFMCVSCPTNNPTATRLGLCSSLG